MKTTFEVPVFPFENLVLFPGLEIPFKVSMPVYVEMIKEVDAEGGRFAVGLTSAAYDSADNSPVVNCGVRQTMALCEVSNLLEAADGSLSCKLKVIQKIRLVSTLQTSPYLRCKAELWEDSGYRGEIPYETLCDLRNSLYDWIDAKVNDQNQREFLMSKIKDEQDVVSYSAYLLIKDVEIKQMILESENLLDRINILETILIRGAGQALLSYLHLQQGHKIAQ